MAGDRGGEGSDRDDRGHDAGDGVLPEPTPGAFAIAGLGASAGGLEALEQFFDALPPDPGIAFVVVTHQQPGRPSLMPELLGRHTAMPVLLAEDGTEVAPDHVYVAPSSGDLSIAGGRLRLHRVGTERPHLPIDVFFRALAEDQRERAIGIVLSGTGTDGTLGLKEIKGASGMVMAQSEQSARYAGMPRSAMATGMVDFTLPAEQLPGQLLAYVRGPHFARGMPAVESAAMQRIFALLREQTPNDFSAYKPTTINRRIQRRMNVHMIERLEDYARFVEQEPAECRALFKELLIGVTSFFRDPEAFDTLGRLLPELLAAKRKRQVVRVWVPGCSTGEEAYSLAILLRECMDRSKRYLDVQIFATDLDADAIELARGGLYPDAIAADVSPERIDRFFSAEQSRYRVKKEIREMIVFAPQNLLSDPPFTRLDLLSCRNLLIYLEGELQRRVLPTFHYALRPGGLLLLGSSESIGLFEELFEPVDRASKIFRRVAGTGSYPELARTETAAVVGHDRPGAAPGREPAPGMLIRSAERMLLDQLVPPTAIVHARGDVVHVQGRSGRYLEPAPGSQKTANIFNMVRQGLQLELATALRRAAETTDEVVHPGVRVRTDGGEAVVDLRVQRIARPEVLRGLFRVTFAETAPPEADDEGRSGSDPAPAPSPPDRLAELERELYHSREVHQNAVEELEAANEELKATNEELQSTNEELQSTNEELETSKEEMQSLNEELQTVNAELQDKIEALSRANDDMKNLLNGTEIATVFLDSELRIKRYTEPARRLIRMLPSDVGRPISDLVSRLRDDGLLQSAREVLGSLLPQEREVQAEEGTWYQMRILPYRTTENVIAGLVITFTDVTRLRKARVFEEVLQTVRQPVVVLDGGFNVVSANQPFCAWVGLQIEALEGRSIDELAEEDRPALSSARLRRVLAGRQDGPRARDAQYPFPELGRRLIQLELPADPADPGGGDAPRQLFVVVLEPSGGA